MPHTEKPKPSKLVRKRLDVGGVKLHFDSLASIGGELEIRIKEVAGGNSSATGEGLESTRRRLIGGEIVAVQIHFFQDEAWWCDTVMRAGDTFRLVRMRQE